MVDVCIDQSTPSWARLGNAQKQRHTLARSLKGMVHPHSHLCPCKALRILSCDWPCAPKEDTFFSSKDPRACKDSSMLVSKDMTPTLAGASSSSLLSSSLNDVPEDPDLRMVKSPTMACGLAFYKVALHACFC